MKFCNLFSKLTKIQNGTLFNEIIGYDHIKKLKLKMKQTEEK